MREGWNLYRAIRNDDPDGIGDNEIRLVSFESDRRAVSRVIYSQDTDFLFADPRLCYSRPHFAQGFLALEEDILRETASDLWGIEGMHFSYRRVSQIPGEYHPRLFRPIVKWDRSRMYFDREMQSLSSHNLQYVGPLFDTFVSISSLQQLETLINRLKDIFLFVEPVGNNLECYGFEIRNLLILAATECEEQMKGVLKSNNYPVAEGKLGMKHYVHLADLMKLRQYCVALPMFPNVGAISPFDGWDKDRPGQSLDWYLNYNNTKHGRSSHFSAGNLNSAISAVAAVCVLIVAQYGNVIPHWSEVIGNFFSIVRSPKWQADECYLPPFKDFNWRERPVFGGTI